jgi:hypothetical protein
LDKTYKICGDTNLFIKLLQQSYSFHPYLDNGVAAALNIPSTKKEMLLYLSDTKPLKTTSYLEGREGFIKLLKAYDINNDKRSYLKLFERFLKVCHLLVD